MSYKDTETDTTDDIYTVLEMHVNLDLEGFEDMTPEGEPSKIALPYIVNIDEGSGEILSIRKNFKEGEEIAKKVNTLFTTSLCLV